jgi:ribose/xylose/arabinose/galactoside ABC-type transport system permease subunit
MTIQQPGSARNDRPGSLVSRRHLDIDTPALLRRLMPFLILAVTVAVVSSQVPRFFSTGNLAVISQQTSFISLLVLGQTFVLIYGGFDLSVGSLFAVAGVLAAYGSHMGWPFALLLPLGFGLASGMLNGLLIGRVGMAPFIVTLAELLGYGGLALALTHQGQVINVQLNTYFTQLATGSAVFGIDNLITIMIVAYIIGAVVLNRTRYGAFLFAVGGNRDSARMLGVPVIRTVIITYMISGALAALGGTLFAAYSSTGQPTVGTSYELQSIAAAVVGGCVLGGGVGTVSGPLAGALILGTVQDFVNLDPHFNAYTQNIVYGVFVIVVVVIQQALNRRQGTRRQERAARRLEQVMTEVGPSR